MNKLMAVGALTFLLFACGKEENKTVDSGAQAYPGVFTGIVSGEGINREYKVAVACTDFGTDYFGFSSDKTSTVDSNGDGIIITGMAFKNKFIVSIKDHGQEFSTGRLENVSMRQNGMDGSGPLFEDNARGAPRKVRFSMDCG